MTESELMRILASNLETKTLASGVMEELLKHVNVLVNIGWKDEEKRHAYFGKFPNLTNPQVQKMLQQPIV